MISVFLTKDIVWERFNIKHAMFKEMKRLYKSLEQGKDIDLHFAKDVINFHINNKFIFLSHVLYYDTKSEEVSDDCFKSYCFHPKPEEFEEDGTHFKLVQVNDNESYEISCLRLNKYDFEIEDIYVDNDDSNMNITIKSKKES